MMLSRFAIAAGLLLGTPVLAQAGANVMVPTIPGMFGIDTCGAFLCGSPATVPNGSKRAIDALEAAFRPRAGKRGALQGLAASEKDSRRSRSASTLRNTAKGTDHGHGSRHSSQIEEIASCCLSGALVSPKG